MDGVMLGFIARELKSTLLGARVDRVLQPEKDELHLVLRGQGGSHRLLLCASANNARVHITKLSKPNPQEPPMFCMLLRKLLGAGRLSDVRQIGGDRIIEFVFDTMDELGEPMQRILSCEIMGRHSNIILRDATGRISDAIRHVGADVSRVREVKPGLPYAPPPPQDKLDPNNVTQAQLEEALALASARLDKAITETLAGFGAHSAREAAYRLTAQDSPHVDAETRSRLVPQLLSLLLQMPTFGSPVLYRDEAGLLVDVFPFLQKHLPPGQQREVPEGPSAALDDFYRIRDQRERISQKASSLQRSLKTHIERTEKKLALHEEILADEESIEEARICGELLTANLHLIQGGKAQAEVPDYYTGATRVIPLDVRLSPAHNAQKYYKQYQKMRAAQRHATEQVAQAREELTLLASMLDDLRKTTDVAELDEIRQELVQRGYLRASHNRGKPKKLAPSKPLTVLSSDGVPILIGKNGAQNDRLTAAALPDTTWLHAKNMPGSHVIIDSEEVVSEETLREAALLAAWYSSGYRSAQVPVDYTLRRHVKKPSGAAPGFVIYTHQNTMYITPDEAAVRRLLGEAE